LTHSILRKPIQLAACLVLVPLFCLGMASGAAAAGPSAGHTLALSELGKTTLVTEVQKKRRGYNRKGYRGNNYRRNNKVRRWSRRPHYGQFVAGITLGTLLGVGLAGAAPPPPAPGLCWYWSDPYMQYGNWDYCY
jgi:hypothetical protein